MSGMVVTLLIATGMFTMIWIAFGHRRSRLRVERRTAGQLTAAERRRLYKRLGLDPAAMTRQRQSNVIWRDPRVIDHRRTDA